MDYSEYGGSVLLGLEGTVVKAHGSSNAKAFYSAIRQAKIAGEQYNQSRALWVQKLAWHKIYITTTIKQLKF
ncbi:hypothetical protein [Staphylococcus aureus]|uniref:hypothetical protein n=1 Tax=Staphylococcus aureus TaxID=1280 RepID=UPI00345F0286